MKDSDAQKARLVTEMTVLEGRRVLDAGCGDGQASRILARHSAQLVGFDPNADSIQRAMASLSATEKRKVQFVAQPFAAMSFAPASFDVVVCMRSL